MKKVFFAALLVGGLVAGAAWFVQKQSAQRTAELQAALQAREQEAKESKAAAELARKQAREMAKASDEIVSQALAREAATKKAASAGVGGSAANGASAEDAKGGFGKMMSNMLKDPDMKEMILGQQRMVMNQLYAPLMRKLQLSGSEETAFMDLLTTNLSTATEMAASMFGGSKESGAEMAKKIAAEQEAMESRMKELLGEDRYKEYKEYQSTAGERAQLNMFQQQLAGIGERLGDAQVEQLLALMQEEKTRATASTGVAFPDGTKGQFPGAMSDEQIEKLMQMQEMANEGVYNRANGILSEAQLAAFSRYQSNQLQMVRMGLNMYKKLMAPGAEGQTQ